MKEKTTQNDICAENLADAGCGRDLIELYFRLQEDGKIGEQRKLLAGHRQILMDIIHKNQKYLDCLDYFLYCLKKKGDCK